jgi:adenosylcobinamide-GDP ribazoletransferase
MNKLAPSARRMVLALQYFTRLPIPAKVAAWTGFDADMQRASLAHFPGAGLVVGAVSAICYGVAYGLLPAVALSHLAAAVLSTAAAAWLTGALHEDGLADTVDGLSSGLTREQILEAMKDSRLGGAGAMALVGVLAGKVLLLGLIGSVAGWGGAVAALLAGHTVSRGLTLAIVATLPNISREGVSKSLGMAQGIDRAGLFAAAIWCAGALVVAAVLASPGACIAGLGLAGAALLWLRRVFARRLQGFTGDCLGATQQLCEIAFYLGAAALAA